MRRALYLVATLVGGALLGLTCALLWATTRGEQPQPWHRLRPAAELTAESSGEIADLAAYRRLENRLFEETRTALARQVSRFPAFSRFDPRSPTNPARFPRNWNRTFELGPAGDPAGEALLLHGLSDSPYSLRAVGELLAAQGFHVVGLRLPGHGTVPGGLAAARRDDWRVAVRLGVGATGGRARQRGVPFVVVGYSNGSALALDYTLTALEKGDGPVPDRLIFLSPAFAVTPAAAWARWPYRASHVPGLSKLAWTSIEPEFDPFKFNSFPVLAGAEIHDLTLEIEETMIRLEAAKEVRALPPILALQSVVDATIPPVESLTRLFSRSRGNQSTTELVLFDANRAAGVRALLSPATDELLALATPGRSFLFRVSLITNARTGTATVEEVSRAPGETTETRRPLGLAWPKGVYSLSHVAVPFPPDDPVYGMETSSLGPPFPFGALNLRGERGALLIPNEFFVRLRCNPFMAVVAAKIRAFVATGPPPIAGATTAAP